MKMCWTNSVLVMMIMFIMVGGGSIYTEGAAVSRQVVLEVFTAFKEGIRSEALASWDTSNESSNPCTGDWAGLQCQYGMANDNTTIMITNIRIDLNNQSLNGSITPQLSRLSGALVSLDLSYNSLSGTATFLSNFSSSDDSLEYLALDYNKLQGSFTLPPSCFPRLQFLSVAKNSFSGHLPSAALSQCPSLQSLNVSSNFFTGPLFPAGLGNLTTTLTSLDTGINNLSGPIPLSIGNCSMLTFLSLPWNSLSGQIPSSIGIGCPNLQFLSLFENRLSGAVPLEMGLLSKLSYLSIGVNNFSGEIFQALANCSSLTTVDTSNAILTGQMPVDFGSRFPNLRVLNMEFNMLTGSIPASIGNCSGLNKLILGFHHTISGIIPPGLFRARGIIHLDLQFNSLSGSIPPEIRNLTSLQKAFLNNNHFTGSLPDTELGMLASIQVLTLEQNFLSGNFPNQVFNCTTLLGLSVHDNSLGGPISSSIGRLINLGSFNASSNSLTGQIPLELSNCTRLLQIGLSNNMLSGEIPRVVIPGLQVFIVSHNNLSGPIPDAEFGGDIQLQTLDLSHNKLSGAVPSGLAACVELASLDLSQNRLTGSIPSFLGESLLSLVELDLSHNSFNGSIPDKLSSLGLLKRLDLSSNALSGTIPSTLAEIKSLQFLNLSYNGQLEGLIPTGGVFKNITTTSFLGDSMLCGPAINTTCTTRKKDHTSRMSKLKTISVAVAASILLIILGFLAFILLRHIKSRRSRAESNWDFSPFLRLKLEDIQEATGDFSEDNVLGSGVTGTVYKGTLRDGTTVAFKKFKMDISSTQSFIRELESVRLIRHRNLAKIMGYFSNQLDANILTLEYMPNGSLEDHLHGGRNQHEALSWEVRLRAAVGIAQGLCYLHNDCPAPVIHCDLKPQNILFDANMEVRITDFGLAKVMTSAATSSLTENMQGTLGYMAPELASFGHISRKCDVYSYGVLLMELVTGRRPSAEVQMMQVDGEVNAQGTKTLVQWVASMLQANDIKGILDKELQARYDTSIGGDEIDQMKQTLNLALQCTKENPRARPTMQYVVKTLSSITSTDLVPLKPEVLQEILSPNGDSMAKSQQNNSFSI